MTITIDILDGTGFTPKRGDILQTNVGDRRERTCLILRARAVKPINGVPRFKVWAERWWQLEPEFRQRLFESAERSSGQSVYSFKRYPARKKRTNFEDMMRYGLARRRERTNGL